MYMYIGYTREYTNTNGRSFATPGELLTRQGPLFGISGPTLTVPYDGPARKSMNPRDGTRREEPSVHER
jgi:hypothetical protein